MTVEEEEQMLLSLLHKFDRSITSDGEEARIKSAISIEQLPIIVAHNVITKRNLKLGKYLRSASLLKAICANQAGIIVRSVSEAVEALNKIAVLREEALNKIVPRQQKTYQQQQILPSAVRCLCEFYCKAFLQHSLQTETQLLSATQRSHPHNEGDVILVVGGGAREHALCCALLQEPTEVVKYIFAAPGNFGTLKEDLCRLQNVNILATDVQNLVTFAKYVGVTMVVVGPETSLESGIVDAFEENNISAFGPTKVAANIETSKAFAKEFFKRNNIPTAEFCIFEESAKAVQFLQSLPDEKRVVIKASGLAAGKGVLIPQSREEAIFFAEQMLMGHLVGSSGEQIVIEEFLEGEEFSLMAFTDGVTIVPMPPAQDNKRLLDGNRGPNTGGMGAYAPCSWVTRGQLDYCCAIIQKIVFQMDKEGYPFKGVIYGGFMLTTNGPRLLEINARFGDPETQAILPLLQSSLYSICKACCTKDLHRTTVCWNERSYCCSVVCTTSDYGLPTAASTSNTNNSANTSINILPVVHGLPLLSSTSNRHNHHNLNSSVCDRVKIFHAATTSDSCGNCRVARPNSRVLTAVAKSRNLKGAVEAAYKLLKQLHFDGIHYRRDIGNNALKRPLRLGILCSSRGTNLFPITHAIDNKFINATIVVVVTNNSKAAVVSTCQQLQLNCKIIEPTKGNKANHDREHFDIAVTRTLNEHLVDLIIMIGYKRIATPLFTSYWSGQCINAHPSLLPNYKGLYDMQVHNKVIADGKKLSGCSVHFVTEDVDGGPIICQYTCKVEVGVDTAESLKIKVQELEGNALCATIQTFQQSGHFAKLLVYSSFRHFANRMDAFLKVYPEHQHLLSQDKSDNHNEASQRTLLENFNEKTKHGAVESSFYAKAGVDIEVADSFVQEIKALCKTTNRSGCEASLGGFAAAFNLGAATSIANCQDAILVVTTDGVGTKLKLAQRTNILSTIGIDLVAMSANDVLVAGAEPILFLDYIAIGHLDIDVGVKIVEGIVAGCKLAGCALVGGETAEMPLLYKQGDFDLAGFCLGAVRRGYQLPQVGGLHAGQVVIGLPSTGLHSNGFSLVNKCLDSNNISLDSLFATHQQTCRYHATATVGDVLLTPTLIYAKLLLPILTEFPGLIKAIANITGGGLIDNIPRVLSNVSAKIDFSQAIFFDSAASNRKWQLPDIFVWLWSLVPDMSQFEMLRTFNCGIGMVIILDKGDVPTFCSAYNLLVSTYPEIFSSLSGCVSADEMAPIVLGELIQSGSGEEKVIVVGSLK